MLDFIYQYGWIILFLVFAGLYFYELCRKQGKAATIDILRLEAFKLMLLAEKRFGRGNGRFKFAWVVDKMYVFLPDTARIFFSREMAEKYVQKWYDELKDYLDDEQINESIQEDQTVFASSPESRPKDNPDGESPESEQPASSGDEKIRQ